MLRYLTMQSGKAGSVQVLLDDSFLGTIWAIWVVDEISEKARNHVPDRSRRLENHQ